MSNVLLLRFGELYLKGKNRNIFEAQLLTNIRLKLKDEQHILRKTFGRYIVSGYPLSRENIIIEKLQQVFGLFNLSKAIELDTKLETIEDYIKDIKPGDQTFRVSVKRADKKFPIGSMDLAKRLGSIIFDSNENSKVDLYHPQLEINVDIRENNKTYIFYDSIPCQKGLPLGSAGKALLLLSGGIDSPVAGYLMSKRGLKLHALHFHSYPYTSAQAKGKVIALAQKLTNYCADIKLHIVSFTKIQEEIHTKCRSEYMITIMRRIMMRIAEQICNENNLGAIITGESLGQVASQTMQSMTVTGNVVKEQPVFRPCVAMDKEDIIEIAKHIDTFETSILPYEDCCTVFLPKFPVIKPTLERAEKEESFLDIDSLIKEAMENQEVLDIKA